VRLAHQRDAGFAAAGEIGDAGGIEPAMGCPSGGVSAMISYLPLRRPMTASLEPRLRSDFTTTISSWPSRSRSASRGSRSSNTASSLSRTIWRLPSRVSITMLPASILSPRMP